MRWSKRSDGIAAAKVLEHRFYPFSTMDRIFHSVVPEFRTVRAIIRGHDGLDESGDIIDWNVIGGIIGHQL